MSWSAPLDGTDRLQRAKARYRRRKRELPNGTERHGAPAAGRAKPLRSHCACFLTRNFRLCFQWLPWALVLRWASVATWIRSHSSGVGSGRCCSDRIISSFRLRSRFCSISLRLATRFESSRTTVDRQKTLCTAIPHGAQKLLVLGPGTKSTLSRLVQGITRPGLSYGVRSR